MTRLADALRCGRQGQAAVELVVLLPLLAVLCLGLWQAVLAGHAAWSVGQAASAAARAQALGGDAEAAARARLAEPLRRGVRVQQREDRVSVRVAVPTVLAVRLGTVSASSSLPVQAP